MEKIQPTQLQENSIILVKGKVNFSRVMSKFEGKELLKREHANKTRNPRYIEKTEPYGTITISDAEIIPEVPGNLNINEQYIAQKFYKTATSNSYRYSKDITGKFLPFIAEKKENSNGYREVVNPEGELANDLEVILILRVFKPKNFNNKSISLQGILIEGKVQYYESNANLKRALAARGIEIDDIQVRDYTEKKSIDRPNVQTMPKTLESNSADDIFSSVTGIRVEENIDKLPY